MRTFYRSLLTLSAKERKALVTLSRAQYVPRYFESQILAFQAFGDKSGVDALQDTHFRRLCSSIRDYIQSPLWSGLVLDLARAVEPTKEEYETLIRASWEKEIIACNSERRPSTLNFNAIFYPHVHGDEEFLPGIPAKQDVNFYLASLITEWRSSVCNQEVHFPRLSSKFCSRRTAAMLEQEFPAWKSVFDEEDDMLSQCVLERLASDTGIEVGGPCEIRQKLYRSGMTPRTYFAQGGDAFFSSKYFQNSFSHLVDLLPISNHVLRLIPSNLDLHTGGNHVFIYDLTSFTSLFHEFLPFIRSLADFCLGHTFVVWHPRYGKVDLDLGEELHKYADVNANCPAYSAVRAKRWGDEVFYHMVAGFLGVYGNLMICTFLHACVVLSVVGDARKCYVAGDDGGAVVFASLVLTWTSNKSPPKPGNAFYDDVNILFYALALLGLIQWSKVFTTQESGAIALKRPLVQTGEQLHQPQMIIWPSLQLINLFINWHNRKDIRFTTLYTFNRREEVRDMSCGELLRFQTNIFYMQHRIAEGDLGRVWNYLEWVYDRLGLRLCGSVPQLPLHHLDSMYPCIEGGPEQLREEPIKRTISRLWQGYCRLPAREGEGSSYCVDVVDEASLYVGQSFIGAMSPLRSYLRKCRYLRCEPLYVTLVDPESLQVLLDEYDRGVRNGRALYRITVVSLPPILNGLSQ
jgi:hypothetical protein